MYFGLQKDLCIFFPPKHKKLWNANENRADQGKVYMESLVLWKS